MDKIMFFFMLISTVKSFGTFQQISLSPEPSESSLSSSLSDITTFATLERNQTDYPTAKNIKPTVVTTPSRMDSVCPKLKSDMDSLTQTQFTSELTNSCRYDKLIKPNTDYPLPVYMQMDLRYIDSADQLQFKVHMMIQYTYRDDRLRYDKISPGRPPILGQELLRQKIWTPHVIIRNEKHTSLSGIDDKDIFISISPPGDVIYSYRMTTTFYCWMNLQKFPFDSQKCHLRWASWTYNASSLVLRWRDEAPVKIAKNLYLTEFTLDDTWVEETQILNLFTDRSLVGNFSELVFHFKITRQVGYYILEYFLPSILLVCTSWVGFWLQADSSPSRVILGTSTMLAFVTLNGGVTKNLPKVSYIKASEIWFMGCVFFIFCSMAEFAFVNVIARRKKKVELKKQNSMHILKCAITPSLARKQLRRAESGGSLYKPRSCSSIYDGIENDGKQIQTHFLSVNNFRNTLQVPSIYTRGQDDLIESVDDLTISVPEAVPKPNTWHTMTPQEVAYWIDKKSRICFPLTFMVFNVFYWCFVYLV